MKFVFSMYLRILSAKKDCKIVCNQILTFFFFTFSLFCVRTADLSNFKNMCGASGNKKAIIRILILYFSACNLCYNIENTFQIITLDLSYTGGLNSLINFEPD